MMPKTIIYVLLSVSTMLSGILACGGLAQSGITEANVRVTGLPQFVCPTDTPMPTHTPLPTATQRATATRIAIATPMVYATNPPTCNYSQPASYRYACLPNACMWSSYGVCGTFYIRPTNIPSGYWSGGGVGYGPSSTPRPTHTPRPTYTPFPTPTPYIISENYHMGADVYVGDEDGLALRLQVANAYRLLAGDRQIVVWAIEIENVGSVTYHALPGAQVFVSHLLVNGQTQSGQWFASAEAVTQANVTLDERALDIMAIGEGESMRLWLAAFTPIGEIHKIGWILDPYASAGGGVVGGNTALWVNEADTYGCDANISGDFNIPTPSASAPTATASVTPYIPPYWGFP
jgi:hypothetical protein